MNAGGITRRKRWQEGARVFLLVVFFFGCAVDTADGVSPPSQDQTTAPAEARLAPSGAAYYVAPNGSDSNPGTESLPWRTVQKAADSLVAGETVFIRAGTYEEQVIPQNSGSAGNTITYTAYPGETVTIDGKNVALPAYESGLFTVEDTNYIKISGLRMINAGPNDNNAGIYVDNAHHIIIENNQTFNTTSSGIGVWNGSNIIIDGNEVELACNDGEQEDITVAGTDTFEIKNNHVHSGGPGTLGGEGIVAKDGARNGRIFKNHVHDIIHGERTCLYLDAWDKETFNIKVYQNVLHNCGAGITLASENGGTLRDVKIYNNIVYDNISNGLEIGNWGVPGVAARPIENIIFINNTVYNNGSGTWGGGFFNENPDVKNVVVRNNIFSQNSVFQIANETTTTGLTIDHNLIHDYTGEFEYEIRGNDYIEGDPKFANPSAGDFNLQVTSPAIDSGSPIDAPGDDYGGTLRPQDGDDDGTAAYDIGAYEVPLYSENIYLPGVLRQSKANG
jgi:parallel beta-helix repeat protein